MGQRMATKRLGMDAANMLNTRQRSLSFRAEREIASTLIFTTACKECKRRRVYERRYLGQGLAFF